MRHLLLLPAGVAAVLLGLPAAPAGASCAAPPGPPRLVDAEQVFVGEVTRTTSGDRVAEVRVRDVWTGPDLPERVVVVGGETARGVSASTDRTYDAGTTYAFFVRRQGGVLRDDACTPTAPVAVHAALDPPGVRGPVDGAPAPVDPRSPAWPWVLGGTAAVVGLGLVAARRLR